MGWDFVMLDILYFNLAFAAGNDLYTRKRKVEDIQECYHSMAKTIQKEIPVSSVMSCAYMPRRKYYQQIAFPESQIYATLNQKLILFPSLTDITRNQVVAVTAIQRWIAAGHKVYLTSYSCQYDTSKYLSNLIKLYMDKKRQVYAARIPDVLIEYALDLRQRDNPVCYEDLKKYIGVSTKSLNRRMEVNMNAHEWGRHMSPDEIEHVSVLRQEYASSVRERFIIYDDRISI